MEKLGEKLQQKNIISDWIIVSRSTLQLFMLCINCYLDGNNYFIKNIMIQYEIIDNKRVNEVTLWKIVYILSL